MTFLIAMFQLPSRGQKKVVDPIIAQAGAMFYIVSWMPSRVANSKLQIVEGKLEVHRFRLGGSAIPKSVGASAVRHNSR
jgi:hypothetical protein